MICSVADCEKPVAHKALCNAHYIRSRRYGDPLGSGRKTIKERVRAKVAVCGNGCWVWTGAMFATTGYGAIRVDGRTTVAHRVSYEAYVEPIPDGLHIDHLCRNRRCVNPAHLEPVTQAINNQRSWDARRATEARP